MDGLWTRKVASSQSKLIFNALLLTYIADGSNNVASDQRTNNIFIARIEAKKGTEVERIGTEKSPNTH